MGKKTKYYELKSPMHGKLYTESCIRRYSSYTVKFTKLKHLNRKAEKISILNIYKCRWKIYKIAKKKMIEKHSEKLIVLSFPSFGYFNL